MKRVAGVSGILCLAMISAAGAQTAPVEMKKPTDLIVAQDPPKVVPRVLEGATVDNTRLTISLRKQRAYLLVGEEVAIDTPVSTGKRRGLTPTGDFTIIDKATEHRSNFHGDFVDAEGRSVRSGASTRVDAAPSGTTFREVPVQFFLQLTPEGLALHAGRLPGYPSTDTSVRLPADIAPLIYQRVKIGTPVKIGD